MEDPIHLRKKGRVTGIIAERIDREIEKATTPPQLTVTITQDKPNQESTSKKTASRRKDGETSCRKRWENPEETCRR